MGPAGDDADDDATADADTGHDRTGEASTPGGTPLDDGTVFTYTHAWSGPVDDVTWTGNGNHAVTIDLSATSPAGSIQASLLHLLINACGGSQINPCGTWFGPAKWQGGPIGVTYSDLRLTLD